MLGGGACAALVVNNVGVINAFIGEELQRLFAVFLIMKRKIVGNS